MLGSLFKSTCRVHVYPKQRFHRHYATSTRQVTEQSQVGQQVTVQGWVKTSRSQKKYTFVELNDGSQRENFHIICDSDQLSPLPTGTCIEATGILVEVDGRKQGKELQNPAIKILGPCDVESYPIHKQGLPVHYLREYLQFRPRTNYISSMLRIRNRATMAVHNYFQNEGFINIHTPIISALDCEGGGELFRVSSTEKEPPPLGKPVVPYKFFGVDQAYLTVSGQLQAEIFACSMSKVYTFGPTFRAEKSDTPRHLAEFWMVEPEVAFADIGDLLTLSEGLVCSVVEDLYKNVPSDMLFFEEWVEKDLKRQLQQILEAPKFEVIPYTDAIAALRKQGIDLQWGDDLSREAEKYICDEYVKKPVFVVDWPKDLKPFYMKVNEDNKTVRGFDLLVPRIGELIGGSVREDNFDALNNRMDEMGLNKEPYAWYLDLRRYGSAPHGGFGMGFERLIQYVTGIKNIKDSIPIPRSEGFCKC